MDEEITILETMIKDAINLNEKNIIHSISELNDYKIIDDSLHLQSNNEEIYKSIFSKEGEAIKLKEYEKLLDYVKLIDALFYQLNNLENFDSILGFLRKNEAFIEDLSIIELNKEKRI